MNYYHSSCMLIAPAFTESTGYSPFRLMMGEECSLPQDVSTDELRTNREHDVAPHAFATWVCDALGVAYDHVRHSQHRTSAQRKWLYDVKAVNRKFPVGWRVLHYYPPADRQQLHVPLSRGHFSVFPSEALTFYITLNRCRWTICYTMMSRHCVPGQNQHAQ